MPIRPFRRGSTPPRETPDRDKILETALQRNPAIRQMEADVRRAQAMLDLARKAGVPDFSVGIEVGFQGQSRRCGRRRPA